MPAVTVLDICISELCYRVAQLNIQILQGIAAVDLKRGGRLYRGFLGSSSENAVVEEY